MSATETSLNVTDAMLDGVLLVREAMSRTGHTASVEAPTSYDDQQDGLFVQGHKAAALGRCAFVGEYGEIEWLQ